MGSKDKPIATTWRSTQGDLTDEEWDLIADLIPTYSGNGRMGRPTKWDKRDIVNAIFYVAATGCQWRALPPHYPHWNTVHRYHVRWSSSTCTSGTSSTLWLTRSSSWRWRDRSMVVRIPVVTSPMTSTMQTSLANVRPLSLIHISEPTRPY